MILYFTGTGNSGYAAQQLAALTDDRAIALTEPGADVDARGERVVWVMPVYSWGVPPVVAALMRRLDLGATGRHFLVVTCGDDIGNTHRQWQRLARRRRWSTAGQWSLQMPNTYTLMKGFNVDSTDVARRKLEAAPTRLEHIARAIMADSDEVDVVRGSWAWAKSAIIRPWFARFAMSPRPFHALESCTGCGRCASLCPLGNIAMDGTPRWGDNCALCLRCYHACPQHAVAYGKATVGKGQYLCPNFKFTRHDTHR
jgi:ferredoxin